MGIQRWGNRAGQVGVYESIGTTGTMFKQNTTFPRIPPSTREFGNTIPPINISEGYKMPFRDAIHPLFSLFFLYLHAC